MAQIHNVAFCPHCGNTTPQVLVYQHEFDSVVAYDAATGQPAEEGGPFGRYYIAKCSTCQDLHVYYSLLGEQSAEHFTTADLVYPATKSLTLRYQRQYAPATQKQRGSKRSHQMPTLY